LPHIFHRVSALELLKRFSRSLVKVEVMSSRLTHNGGGIHLDGVASRLTRIKLRIVTKSHITGFTRMYFYVRHKWIGMHVVSHFNSKNSVYINSINTVVRLYTILKITFEKKNNKIKHILKYSKQHKIIVYITHKIFCNVEGNNTRHNITLSD